MKLDSPMMAQMDAETRISEDECIILAYTT
jgi:hypothetical protein